MSIQEEEIEEQLTGAPAKQPTASQYKKAGAALLAEPSAIFIPLPSKSILYKDEPSLESIKDGMIQVRPMTLRELELFLKPELIETGTLIDAILQNCIKSNVDPKNLLASDRSYLLMWIRSQSFGPNYRFKFPCGNCNKSISTKVNLSDLPIITMDEIHAERNEDGEIIESSVKKIKEPFSTELPHSNVRVYFQLSRGYDESTKSTNNYYKRLKKENFKNSAVERRSDGSTVIRNIDPENKEEGTFVDEQDETTIKETLLQRIVRIDGVDEDQIPKALDNMLGGDISYLQEAIKNSDSGLDMDITVKCPSCKYDNKLQVPFTESFFRSSL